MAILDSQTRMFDCFQLICGNRVLDRASLDRKTSSSITKALSRLPLFIVLFYRLIWVFLSKTSSFAGLAAGCDPIRRPYAWVLPCRAASIPLTDCAELGSIVALRAFFERAFRISAIDCIGQRVSLEKGIPASQKGCDIDAGGDRLADRRALPIYPG
jgi:hypothetical protein